MHLSVLACLRLWSGFFVSNIHWGTTKGEALSSYKFETLPKLTKPKSDLIQTSDFNFCGEKTNYTNASNQDDLKWNLKILKIVLALK